MNIHRGKWKCKEKTRQPTNIVNMQCNGYLIVFMWFFAFIHGNLFIYFDAVVVFAVIIFFILFFTFCNHEIFRFEMLNFHVDHEFMRARTHTQIQIQIQHLDCNITMNNANLPTRWSKSLSDFQKFTICEFLGSPCARIHLQFSVSFLFAHSISLFYLLDPVSFTLLSLSHFVQMRKFKWKMPRKTKFDRPQAY